MPRDACTRHFQAIAATQILVRESLQNPRSERRRHRGSLWRGGSWFELLSGTRLGLERGKLIDRNGLNPVLIFILSGAPITYRA